MADVPVFEWKGVSIASMSKHELLMAIQSNEDSRNYPDSATTILLAEGVKRILASNINLESKQAAQREQVIQEMLAGTDEKGDELDGRNE
ncbi:hypothetical protein [Levilactobacillus brevis]|uniref:hypothetical protein n=1 Tax=Levilactobacillus brevis TaxID=1580 RepID=UPI001BDE4088|nr:hypothetical protein [Levilactobacillus brevis]